MISKKELHRQMEQVEERKIFLYHLEEAEKEIKKGNNNVKVLYSLLLKEINQHNGNITRRYRKLRNTPTAD